MITKLPAWFKQDIPDAKTLKMQGLLSEFGVNTVCREAKCPNIANCFKNKQVTFLILGDSCTRNCRFCNVKKSEPSFNNDEPHRISELVRILGLNYVVVTSVTRDDLSDGGASQFARTEELIHAISKKIKIELLIPDFQGKISSLKCVLDAKPDVVGHNIETVRRLYPDLRPMADYGRSLKVLRKIKELRPQVITKSSVMLGMGEIEEEVIDTMKDLGENQCDILTLGQYLAPSVKHYPVKEFISPEQFEKYQNIALDMGFKSVLSGPLVRSSYRAEELFTELTHV